MMSLRCLLKSHQPLCKISDFNEEIVKWLKLDCTLVHHSINTFFFFLTILSLAYYFYIQSCIYFLSLFVTLTSNSITYSCNFYLFICLTDRYFSCCFLLWRTDGSLFQYQLVQDIVYVQPNHPNHNAYTALLIHGELLTRLSVSSVHANRFSVYRKVTPRESAFN